MRRSWRRVPSNANTGHGCPDSARFWRVVESCMLSADPIGAKKSDIVLQFLLEAAVLTAMGGIAGIIFGWLVSVASRLVFESLPATVPLWAAVLGILVSVGVGLFFGIWPAYKAAGLDPVDALRYE